MRIVQMVDALDYGDGVSNDIINLHLLMDNMKVDNTVYSRWMNERVAHYTHDINTYSPKEDDYILYHYSGKSTILEQVLDYNLPVILRYHNITPPKYLVQDNPELADRCREGIEQIKSNVRFFDFYCGDSEFNNRDLIAYGADADRAYVLPVAMNLSKLHETATDKKIIQEMKKHPNIIFVGRIAPNKCIEDVLDVFDNFHKYYNDKAFLYLVGNMQQTGTYTKYIQDKINKLTSKEHIIMTGKVDDSQLSSYYSGADVFLCMSEHEGFCIPLLEAMEFNIPVIAYDAGAVAGTMGESGILVKNKVVPIVAGLLNELTINPFLRSRVVQEQQKHLQEFDTPAMKKQLAKLISIWTAS